MLDPKELRTIALKKRLLNKQAVTSTVTKPAFTEEQVLSYVKDLTDYVLMFAEDGHLSIDYLFKDVHSFELIQAVALKFKVEHPLLMVIVASGLKKITVTWDNKNHV